MSPERERNSAKRIAHKLGIPAIYEGELSVGKQFVGCTTKTLQPRHLVAEIKAVIPSTRARNLLVVQYWWNYSHQSTGYIDKRVIEADFRARWRDIDLFGVVPEYLDEMNQLLNTPLDDYFDTVIAADG